jgi:hypothetical protein
MTLSCPVWDTTAFFLKRKWAISGGGAGYNR